MSIKRWAAKTDSTQRQLVYQLRAMGIRVWVINQPCDLLLRFWCNRHHDHCWQTLEVKSPYGKRKPKARVDRRQQTQQEFLEETRTPIALDFDSAMRELNMRHAIEFRVSALQNYVPTTAIA